MSALHSSLWMKGLCFYTEPKARSTCVFSKAQACIPLLYMIMHTYMYIYSLQPTPASTYTHKLQVSKHACMHACMHRRCMWLRYRED